ncbi:MAG: hypothetical protein ACJAVI_003170 [Candidatus Azotimanducaceae bacterium]|jgi:hypothetical protein
MKAKHWRTTDSDCDRNCNRAIEFTLLSKIIAYPLSAESGYVRPLAPNARGVGNAFYSRLRQIVGSARRFVTRICRALALSLLTMAILEQYCSGIAIIELNVEVEVRIERQMRRIRNKEARIAGIMSHAQLAVSRVAMKAKHWQPTDSDCDRNCNRAIEFTLLSKIIAYPLSAESFKCPLVGS